MGRPLEKFPRRHVISFRLNDPEFAAFSYLVNQYKESNETFSEAVGRVIKSAVMQGAKKRYVDFCEKQQAELRRVQELKGIRASHTEEPVDKRRASYARKIETAAIAHFNKAAAEAPKRASVDELASVSSSVVARHEAAAQVQADDGDSPTEKIEN